MTKSEQDEILYVLRRMSIKLIETHALMKDGKIIVAYEKLGGVIKIISDYGGEIEACVPTSSPLEKSDISSDERSNNIAS